MEMSEKIYNTVKVIACMPHDVVFDLFDTPIYDYSDRQKYYPIGEIRGIFRNS